MDVVEALGRGLAEPLVDAENQERGEPLGRRRGIIESALADRHRERLARAGAVALQVRPRDGAADALKIGRDLVGDVAAIEIVETGAGELLERIGQAAGRERRALLGRLAVDEEGSGEAGSVDLLAAVGGEAPGVGAGDRIALAGERDGGLQQPRQRHPAALGAGGVIEKLPATDYSRHRERCERAARRDLLEPGLAIELPRGARPGIAAGLDVADAPGRLAEQPEGVTAEVVHVRIGDDDGGPGRQRRLERVAALGEHVPARLGRVAVRRGHHAAAGADAFLNHDGLGRGATRGGTALDRGRDPRQIARHSTWKACASERSEGKKMAEEAAKKGRVNWLNMLTVVSAAILIGTEVIGAGLATAWAIAGFFSLGDIGAYVLQALFGVGAVAVIVAFLRAATRIEPLVER